MTNNGSRVSIFLFLSSGKCVIYSLNAWSFSAYCVSTSALQSDGGKVLWFLLRQPSVLYLHKHGALPLSFWCNIANFQNKPTPESAIFQLFNKTALALLLHFIKTAVIPGNLVLHSFLLDSLTVSSVLTFSLSHPAFLVTLLSWLTSCLLSVSRHCLL